LNTLQSLIEPNEYLLLEGRSDSVWREHIGNLVLATAAKAIGEVCGTTLLLARAGENFDLGATPIWVRNVTLALSVATTGKQRDAVTTFRSPPRGPTYELDLLHVDDEPEIEALRQVAYNHTLEECGLDTREKYMLGWSSRLAAAVA
jgi:hypothetical protein